MAIKSHAFGRVTLTDTDAKKFEAQVTYGRPKAAAYETASRGLDLVRKMKASGGKIKLKTQPAE
jgi:hypothetical protein